MKKFDNTRLWAMLHKSRIADDITQTDAQSILDEFLEELHAYSRDERSMVERIRTLRYARNYLQIYGEEMPSKITEQAISAIDTEIELVKMEMAHPEYFLASRNERAPLAHWNGTIAEVLELMVSIYSAGKMSKPTGESMAYSDVIALIKTLFGIEISKPYDRRTNLFSRKRHETPFLDKLRNAYRFEVEKHFRDMEYVKKMIRCPIRHPLIPLRRRCSFVIKTNENYGQYYDEQLRDCGYGRKTLMQKTGRRRIQHSYAHTRKVD